MSVDDIGSPPTGEAGGEVIAVESQRTEPVQRSLPPEAAADAAALARMAREQLERDIAEIEHATAALRKAEPALESWTDLPVNVAPKAQPVWLLIGALWLSTALVTLGAVVAIASLVG